ncbi:response regulator transcription factor [Pseudonocardia endophytica]|uniref:LuxR family two component transcriptional regulator n=1 Tax=Pseudonocardia endophytica TaxID=401976 RepID=A0A4R1HVB9_PSEEN|nr:response regulator transcription factor [Pseudonocardia endophytica]TCK25343.1 LuxR family two component transcriptional regulator [Pseudonocardia endophytica]
MTTGRAAPIRVLLAEDNFVVREGVRAIVETQDDLELVGTCGDLPELLAAVGDTVPDVVLTDIRMPPTQTDEGVRAAQQLRREHPGIGVVVLSQYVEEGYAVRLFSDGSARRAYLLKERIGDVDDLVHAIREVHGGGSVVDRAVVDALISARTRRSPVDDLTAREREVLAQIARGANNRALGERLSLSSRAVEKHINSIFAKLGLAEEPDSHHRVRAVLLYLAATDGA